MGGVTSWRGDHVIQFFVPGPEDGRPFPSLNEVIDLNRTAPGAGNRMKRKLTEHVARYAREAVEAAGWEAPESPCSVAFDWVETWRGRDQDNITSAQKFVMDGLVSGGVLRNDSQRYVPQPSVNTISIDGDRPGVAVTVARWEA